MQNGNNNIDSNGRKSTSDTKEKLANILTDIRKKKDRTIFDSLMRERPQPSTSRLNKVDRKPYDRNRSDEANTSKSNKLGDNRSEIDDEQFTDFSQFANTDGISAFLNLSSDSESEIRNKVPKALADHKSKNNESSVLKREIMTNSIQKKTLKRVRHVFVDQSSKSDSRIAKRKKKKVTLYDSVNLFPSSDDSNSCSDHETRKKTSGNANASVVGGYNEIPDQPSKISIVKELVSNEDPTALPSSEVTHVRVCNSSVISSASASCEEVSLFGDFLAARQINEETRLSAIPKISANTREKLRRFAYFSNNTNSVPLKDDQSSESIRNGIAVASGSSADAKSDGNGNVHHIKLGETKMEKDHIPMRTIVSKLGSSIDAEENIKKTQKTLHTKRVFSVFSMADDDDDVDLDILDDL